MGSQSPRNRERYPEWTQLLNVFTTGSSTADFRNKLYPLLLKIDAATILTEEIKCPIALEPHSCLAKDIQCRHVNLLDLFFCKDLKGLEPACESSQHVCLPFALLLHTC